MSQAALLLGISKPARKYIWAMMGMQAQGVPREQALNRIRAFIKPTPPLHRLRTEWGILESARKDWAEMDKFEYDELVTKGYKRYVRMLPFRYRTIVGMDVLNRLTGETFSYVTKINNDRFLTRQALREKAISNMPPSAREYLEFGRDKLLEGYLSR